MICVVVIKRKTLIKKLKIWRKSMKIVAIMPIKLINERCSGKNTRMLGGKPLLQYELDSLKKTGLYI